jgi:hypothetical protein
MKLAYIDERVWIRYYNTHIQDHSEIKNGTENWQEILHPFSPTPELDLDEEEEGDLDHQHPFEFSLMEELNMPIYEVNEAQEGDPDKQRAPRRRLNSKGEEGVSESIDDTMDPPQVSTSTFLEIFSMNTSSSEAMGGASNMFLGGQQSFAHQKGGSNGGLGPAYNQQSYYQGYGSPPVPMDNFDPSMVLDGSPHGRAQSTNMAQSDRGYYHMGALLHQDHPPQGQAQYSEILQSSPYQHQHHSQPHRQQNAHTSQQDSNGTFPQFELQAGAPIVGYDPSISSPSSYSAPDSPNQPPLENNLGLGLVPVSAALSLQQQMSMDQDHYLNLVSQQFPNQHIPTQPLRTMDSYQQQQQSLDSTLSSAAAVTNPIVRPFFGMPMGGFMTPGLDSLPVINRTTQAPGYYRTPASSTANGNNSSASAVGQSLSSTQSGWSLESGAASIVASYLPKSEPHSPALPPSLVSSVPTSPTPMHQSSFRLMLSPTSETIQGISNQMNAWDGINGPKVVDSSDLQGPTLLEYSSSNVYHQQQQQQQQQHNHQHHQNANGSLLEAPTAGGSTSHYGGSWSSASSSSELTTVTTAASTISTAGTLSSPLLTRMDGIKAGPSSISSSSASAVPETPFGGYSTSGSGMLLDVSKMTVVGERSG